ncbi:MAG: DUF535 family protein [Candidatus Malihini olakiniferum]
MVSLYYQPCHPRRAQMLYTQMALPDKLQRPYLYSHFSPRNTFTALCYHYDAVVEPATLTLRRLLLTTSVLPLFTE